MNEADVLRFEKNVKVAPGCWEWQAGRSKGYGSFWFDGKMTRAHRASWRIYRGEIADRMHVLHKCDNPPCVNPNHLFLGSQKDNNKDRDEKGRQVAPIGEQSGQSRLKAVDILGIRNEYRLGIMNQVELANKYGVSQAQICRIIHKKSWEHI